ncbi:MAG: KEOPS complex kinase/ATPase Bud32 [Candidatus Bathyarchaeia archaeon]
MLTYRGELIHPKLIYKGAEAEIYLQEWFNEPAIRKTRISKPYRVEQLDEVIRRTRTAHEAIMMHEVKKLGVPVPAIFHIDPSTSTIVMEYVKAPTLKQELNLLPKSTKLARCETLGRKLGQMHAGGIVHGDMTLSNVLCYDESLCIIDFGLANYSEEEEDKGVDLLLFNRVLKSSHYETHNSLFKAFMTGYSTSSDKSSKVMLKKMHEIERRGRYFDRA